MQYFLRRIRSSLLLAFILQIASSPSTFVSSFSSKPFVYRQNSNRDLSLFLKHDNHSQRRLRNLLVAGANFDDLGVGLYDMQLTVSNFIETQLVSLNPVSMGTVYFAGVLASISPCALSMFPFTIGYLGQYTDSKQSRVTRALLYATGLSVVLASFGIVASYIGKLYGSGNIGFISTFVNGFVTLTMGLNLLGLITINIPSLNPSNLGVVQGTWGPLFFGASSALISSSCSSPVLASLLTVVSSNESPIFGGSLIFFYSLGYSSLVIVAGTLSILPLDFSTKTSWVNSLLASFLVIFGTYSLLDSFSELSSSLSF